MSQRRRAAAAQLPLELRVQRMEATLRRQRRTGRRALRALEERNARLEAIVRSIVCALLPFVDVLLARYEKRSTGRRQPRSQRQGTETHDSEDATANGKSGIEIEVKGDVANDQSVKDRNASTPLSNVSSTSKTAAGQSVNDTNVSTPVSNVSCSSKTAADNRSSAGKSIEKDLKTLGELLNVIDSDKTSKKKESSTRKAPRMSKTYQQSLPWSLPDFNPVPSLATLPQPPQQTSTPFEGRPLMSTFIPNILTPYPGFPAPAAFQMQECNRGVLLRPTTPPPPGFVSPIPVQQPHPPPPLLPQQPLRIPPLIPPQPTPIPPLIPPQPLLRRTQQTSTLPPPASKDLRSVKHSTSPSLGSVTSKIFPPLQQQPTVALERPAIPNLKPDTSSSQDPQQTPRMSYAVAATRQPKEELKPDAPEYAMETLRSPSKGIRSTRARRSLETSSPPPSALSSSRATNPIPKSSQFPKQDIIGEPLKSSENMFVNKSASFESHDPPTQTDSAKTVSHLTKKSKQAEIGITTINSNAEDGTTAGKSDHGTQQSVAHSLSHNKAKTDAPKTSAPLVSPTITSASSAAGVVPEQASPGKKPSTSSTSSRTQDKTDSSKMSNLPQSSGIKPSSSGVTVDVEATAGGLKLPQTVSSGDERSVVMAANNGEKELLRQLLEEGANPNARSKKGDTALFHAVNQYHKEAVHLLLQHGADPSLANNSGITPLHRAACGQDAEIVTALVGAGASLEARDHKGHTALVCAMRAGCKDNARLLIDAGADLDDCIRMREKGNVSLKKIMDAFQLG